MRERVSVVVICRTSRSCLVIPDEGRGREDVRDVMATYSQFTDSVLSTIFVDRPPTEHQVGVVSTCASITSHLTM